MRVHLCETGGGWVGGLVAEWGGGPNGHVTASSDGPEEAMSHVIHGAGVLYTLKGGRGGDWQRPLHSNRGQPMEKGPRYLSGGDVIRVEHASPSPHPHPPTRVCAPGWR